MGKLEGWERQGEKMLDNLTSWYGGSDTSAGSIRNDSLCMAQNTY